MANNVLITLTPLGKFFFGGDTTFSIQDKKFDEEYASYIIESRKFPQQTSLLGMLRYLLLSNDSKAFDSAAQKIRNTVRATELIGESGFRDNGGTALEFGYIKSLSPCFLQVRNKKDGSPWENLVPAPRDQGYVISFDESMQSYINGVKRDVPVVEGYDPKEYNELLFIGEKEKIEESKIFCRDARIGIDRDFERSTKEGAFYKQICYRLGEGTGNQEFRFAFNACIETDMTAYDGSIVSVGGDSSYFVLHIGEAKPLGLPASYQAEFACEQKLVLLSDACLDEADAEQVKFAMTETIPFRFLKTTVKTENYSILNREVERHDRIRLFRKGSVFFGNSDQIDRLGEALGKRKDFFQIGYNHYQVISNTKNNNYEKISLVDRG